MRAVIDELRRTCFVKPQYDFDFGRFPAAVFSDSDVPVDCLAH